MVNDTSILVVEDSRDDLFLLERAWKRAGLTIPLVHAYDGKEAMDHLRVVRSAKLRELKLPKVVLTDIKMPRVSGFELLEFIRKDRAFSSIVPLVWSNSTEVEDLRKAYDLGVRCYLPKPSSQHSWKMLIERVMEFYNG